MTLCRVFSWLYKHTRAQFAPLAFLGSDASEQSRAKETRRWREKKRPVQELRDGRRRLSQDKQADESLLYKINLGENGKIINVPSPPLI